MATKNRSLKTVPRSSAAHYRTSSGNDLNDSKSVFSENCTQEITKELQFAS